LTVSRVRAACFGVRFSFNIGYNRNELELTPVAMTGIVQCSDEAPF
jgi:hypothetical protein